MKKLFSVLFVFSLFAILFSFLNKPVLATSYGDDHKIDICHATASESNPYTTNNVDKNSTAQGHDIHEGDIIPPFSWSFSDCPTDNSEYGFWLPGKTCKKKINGHDKYAYPITNSGSYPGKNWNPTNEEILNNDCKLPMDVDINHIDLTCGEGNRTFNGTAFYSGDSSTRLKVTFKAGNNNAETVVNSSSEPLTWNFIKNLVVGTTYKIEAKIWDNHDGNSSPKKTDSWTFSVNSCPVPGCMDQSAYNYNANATVSDNSCVYDICKNIDGLQTVLTELQYSEGDQCYDKTPVCTDSAANNYDSEVSNTEYANNEVCSYTPISCEWSEWSACSAVCGGGTQTRTHSVEAQYGGAACEGPSEQSCNVQSCIEDQCTNIDEVQANVPDGYYQTRGEEGLICSEKTPVCNDKEATNYEEVTEATYADIESCKYEEPQPSPTPTPSPEPTPGTGGLGHNSKFGVDNYRCEASEITVVYDVFDNNTAIKDEEVTFTFNGETKKAKTNENGRASVNFTRATGEVKAYAAGYPTQSQTLTDLSCAQVNLDPNRSSGQVLGATTLAPTGSADMILATLASAMGLISTAWAIKLYVNKE